MTIQIENQCFEVIDNSPLDSEYMVSIWCITYNHHDYIEDALRGFVEQKTSFNYEVVVMDDCSNDGTTDIIRKYASQYPDIFRIFIAKENFYNNPARIEILTQLRYKVMRGKYIAYCEGDDCWIDRNKLQIQIDYMEQNPDCTLTVHDGIRIDYDDGLKIRIFEGVKEESDLTLEDIMFYKCRMDTASMVMRSEDLIMDGIFCNLGIGDWPRLLYSAVNGRVHFLDRTMSLYRFRVPGSWTKNRADDLEFEVIHRLKLLDFMEKFNEYTNGRYTLLALRYERECIGVILYVMKGISCKEQERLLDLAVSKYPYVNQAVSEYKRSGYFIGQTREYPELLIPEVKDLIRNKRIVIWGIGRGGSILTDYFDLVGENVYCYCVADDTTTSVFEGKAVRQLSEFTQKDDVMVVVAIYSLPFSKLAEILDEHKIVNAYFPFVYGGVRHRADYSRGLNNMEGFER